LIVHSLLQIKNASNVYKDFSTWEVYAEQIAHLISILSMEIANLVLTLCAFAQETILIPVQLARIQLQQSICTQFNCVLRVARIRTTPIMIEVSKSVCHATTFAIVAPVRQTGIAYRANLTTPCSTLLYVCLRAVSRDNFSMSPPPNAKNVNFHVRRAKRMLRTAFCASKTMHSILKAFVYSAPI